MILVFFDKASILIISGLWIAAELLAKSFEGDKVFGLISRFFWICAIISSGLFGMLIAHAVDTDDVLWYIFPSFVFLASSWALYTLFTIGRIWLVAESGLNRDGFDAAVFSSINLMVMLLMIGLTSSSFAYFHVGDKAAALAVITTVFVVSVLTNNPKSKNKYIKRAMDYFQTPI